VPAKDAAFHAQRLGDLADVHETVQRVQLALLQEADLLFENSVRLSLPSIPY
jgi:hypothetical protein